MANGFDTSAARAVGRGLQVGAQAERQRQVGQQRLLLEQEKERQKLLAEEEKARLAAEQKRKTDATIAELITGQTPTTQQERTTMQVSQALGVMPLGQPIPKTRRLTPSEKVERFASLPSKSQVDFVRIQRFADSQKPKVTLPKQRATFTRVNKDGFKEKEIVFDDGTSEIITSSFREDDPKQKIQKNKFDKFKNQTRKAILDIQRDGFDIRSAIETNPDALNEIDEFNRVRKTIQDRQFGTVGDVDFEPALTEDEQDSLFLSPEAVTIRNKRAKIRVQQNFLIDQLIDTQATDNAIAVIQGLEQGLPDDFTAPGVVDQSKAVIDERISDIQRSFNDGSLKITPDELQQIFLWYQINFLDKPNVNL